MNILAIDDEKLALSGLIRTIRQTVPEAALFGFQKSKEALAFAKGTACDIAFLDIEMQGMDGLEMAKNLKMINPSVNIIFVTGYAQYASDAFSLHASGYVMKPVTREMITKELNNLRYPLKQRAPRKIRVQAFGNFEVFSEEKPIKFQYTKTKELFAYLIDRKGALCTNGEIMGILWEEEAHKTQKYSYLNNLRTDLMTTFSKAGYENIVVKQRGSLAVMPENIDCDYFDWLKNGAHETHAYGGEYMTQYSWGEMTLGQIEKCHSKIISKE